MTAHGQAHRPVRITAHLRTGIGYDSPYGLDLAGILAARVRDVDRASVHEQTGGAGRAPQDTTVDDPDDLGLPLARCTRDSEQWHWMATCAVPVDPHPDPEARTLYRVVDTDAAHRHARRPLPYYHPRFGAYRDVMMPAPVTLCRAVRWWAVGDPTIIAALLKPIRFIGRRRNTGEGKVTGWDIEDCPLDADVAGHLGGTATIARPIPQVCADELGVADRLGWYAIRPPSWHRSRLQQLAMTP